MMGHFVFGRQHDLATTVCSYHVVAASEEVLQVLELVLAREIQECEKGHSLHYYI